MECVEKTKEVTRAMENKDWDLAVQLRGRSFMRNLETFKSLSKNIPKNVDTSNGRNLAVINVGAPCCGVNAAGKVLRVANAKVLKSLFSITFNIPPSFVHFFVYNG
jgi:hypothetical protein